MSSKAVSSNEFLAIELQCDTERQPSLCAELAKALTAMSPGRDITISPVSGSLQTSLSQQPHKGLTIRYQEQTRRDSWLSGQLIWQENTDQPVEGPVIEFSVMDRDLQPKDMTSFAKALIRASDLPLSR